MTEEVAPYKVNIPDMSDTPDKVLKPRPGSVPWVKPAGPAAPWRRFMLDPNGFTALELTPEGWEYAMRSPVVMEGRLATAEEAAQWSLPD